MVDAIKVLEGTRTELLDVAQTTAAEVELVARSFEGLARHAHTLLDVSAAIVGSLENDRVSSVLPKLQALGSAARNFVGDRARATNEILDTVTTAVKLLRQLSEVTQGQGEIALQTRTLSILTNVEVARLGDLGDGFQYLAKELAGFSRSVTTDTQELSRHTDARRAAIAETRRVFTAELPRFRQEFARMNTDLDNALSVADSSLSSLSRTPAQFRSYVGDVERQINGVVAAVQSQDITHQQLQHVLEALNLICAGLSKNSNGQKESTGGPGQAYAGLTIQIYQLRTIKDTVANWAGQIRTCMGGIMNVSASEVLSIGPGVLNQEQELSSQIARIERLERESQSHSQRIQQTFGGLADLARLVQEHVERSKSIREHLQLLTFNSIIEASKLGKRASAILAIANIIKEISVQWGKITDDSETSMQKARDLAKQTDTLMEAFSSAGRGQLHDAQKETTTGLNSLRSAASFAANQAQQLQSATEDMKSETSEVARIVDRLEACFSRIDAVLTALQQLTSHWEAEQPDVKELYDPQVIEELFAASYTTEMERAVLRAALGREPLPVANQSLEGNSVELF